MTWTPINFNASVWKDDSPLKAQGYYIDADKIRFVNGAPETIYGWEKASNSTLLGICRGAMTWQDNSRNPLAGFGTHLRLYAMDIDGNVTDTTPAISYAQSSISFTTVNTSLTVTITGFTHTMVADQKFKLENATVTPIGGVTINGTFTVMEVLSATSINYAAASAATSSAGPTASTVDITTYLAPGQIDGLGGIGFGVGGFGTGGYGGSASSVTLYPRTWSMAGWGQNGLFNPRGGGIYEWAPNTTATELVVVGDFSAGASTGLSVGSGWTIGANTAQGYTTGAASDLATNLTALAGAWHLLAFQYSAAAGSVIPVLSGITIGAALTTSGFYRLPAYSNGGYTRLAFWKSTTFLGTIDNVSLKVLTTAQLVTNAPTQVGSMFVTAERIVVACGSNLDGTFDALQVDWSDAENNQTWTATSTNLAGGYTLPSGGRIVKGAAGPRENILWTDDGIWAMRFNANPSSVFDFIQLGTGCGLAGPNAAALLGGVWYWRTPTGAFYAYGGAEPVPVPCTLSRDMQDRMALSQNDKIYAHTRVGKNYAEIWWRWPAANLGNEVSEYVIYDTLKGSWCCGTWDRTACVDASVYPFPLTVDTAGAIWFEEKGFSADGAARTAFIEGAYNKAPGADAIIINGIKPDSDDLQGGYSYIFTSKNRTARGITTRTYSALSITSMTGQKSIRVKGEQVKFRVNISGNPSFWRQGALEADVIGVLKSS